MPTSFRFLPRFATFAFGVAVVSSSAFAQTPAVAKPTSAPPIIRSTPAPRTPESAITPTSVARNPGRHVQFMSRITQGDVGLLFLGDSITDFWPRKGQGSWQKFAPYKPADFGISGERTEDVLWRITNDELNGIHPKVTVLMIGTNNIGHFRDEKPEWAAAGVRKIVETIHQKLPETKVLLLAVFPRATSGSPARAKVNEINQIIAKLDDGKKTRFLDIGKVFLDPKGEIPKDVMPDALHPNAHGYDLWYEAMNPLLTEMLK